MKYRVIAVAVLIMISSSCLNAAADECDLIGSDDLRCLCKGEMSLIADPDLHFLGSGRCILIKNSDLRHFCRKEYDLIEDRDWRKLAKGQCILIEDRDLRLLCKGRK